MAKAGGVSLAIASNFKPSTLANQISASKAAHNNPKGESNEQ
jgi:hypothetical protein